MSSSIQMLNRTMLLACTPFVAMLLWLMVTQISIILPYSSFPESSQQESAAADRTKSLASGLDAAHQTAAQTSASIKKQLKLYNQTNADMAQIVKTASAQANRPLVIYDKIITGRLGSPSGTISSDKLRAQLFYIKADNFQSYALKIKLKSSDAMKMVLGKDKVGGAETTLAAVQRYGAVAGVNAGGFADGGGKRYPLSTTVLNGSYVDGFEPTRSDLFFVGLNAANKLVGGKFTNKQQLDDLNVKFGASFVPVLMKNGNPTTIPTKWQISPVRAPRTVIANYKDGQLLIIVADGRNEGGSSGATLAEMQLLLQRYGAVDGYNLDGGGSSSLIWNGRVINKPSDGQLRKLPTHFLFFK
ncbi:phosphodiester glycosidase family protein [Paenibacillus glycanilyticus]|uniref:phosphodiester glycosidase family protein n=1 Tax=Paenibacillus glycanilyticus TaxID=126569 RepID=UPI00203BDA3E|nr:phosphodiester glycosidase family protein [Paenibacillus glycanilyticus]MCM3630867.1 phosphodiester glycosidase family protein [Paenibacillus glycanilyticus]